MSLPGPLIVIAALLVLATGATAQTPQPKASPKAPGSSKRYCQNHVGFCFLYPAGWSVLGEAFGDGVVVAPHQAAERDQWDAVTVTKILLASESQTATSIDDLIDRAMNGMRAAGHNPETLQRQERTVNGLPAQMIKLRYRDDQSHRDWIEQLVLIDGPEHEIYSVALKAQPGNLARLEPAFQNILRSWKLQQSDGAPASTPASSSPSEAAAKPAHHN